MPAAGNPPPIAARAAEVPAPYPSPNHGERRGTNAPDMVVLHYTGMTDGPAARARLCDPAAEVSAHWLLHEDGTAEALVPEHRRAWHAGAGSWAGRGDINSHSIGVEIVNPGDRPFPAAQMDGLAILLRGICARWHIPPCAVIGHSDMAPERKADPGPRFDWRRLALEGLAICPAPASGAARTEFGALLDRIGFPDAPPDARLHAFRLRFRPSGRGPCGSDDLAQAQAAADALEAARSVSG